MQYQKPLRLLLGFISGYYTSAYFVSFMALWLVFLGLAKSEAVVTSAMFGFIIYLMLIVWAMAEKSFLWVCLLMVFLPFALYFCQLFYLS